MHDLAKYLSYDDAVAIPGLWDYTLAPDPQLFPNSVSGNRASLIKEGVDCSVDAEFGFDSSKYLLALFATRPGWVIDTDACYEVCHKLMKEKLPKSKYHVDPRVAEFGMDLVKDTGLINPKDFMDGAVATAVAEKAGDQGERVLNFLQRVIDLSRMHSVKRNKREVMSGEYRHAEDHRKELMECNVRKLEQIAINDMPVGTEFPEVNVQISVFGSCFFVRFGDIEQEGYLLTSKDFPRMAYYVNAKTAVLKLAAYMRVVYDDVALDSGIAYFSSLFSQRGNRDRMPEAFVSASNISLNTLAGFLSADGMKEMIADHCLEGLEELVPHRKFLDKLSGLSDVQHRLFRSIIRMAMPPSYDVPGIFSEEKRLHGKKNPVGGEISAKAEGTYLDFLAYNRLAFCRQFKKQYGRYPGKIDNPKTDDEKKYNACVDSKSGMKLTLEIARRVNLRGVLAYQCRSGNVGAYLKDTAMMPHTLEPSKRPIVETNQIAYMASATEVLDLEDWRRKFADEGYTHYHKVGYKNEVAKEKGRLFFISELKDKLLLGELEDNIGVFLKGCPGNAVGAPPGDVANSIFSAMCTEPVDGEAKLLISDDISKWSPYMPLRVQKDSAMFWAEVFDQEWIAASTAINERDYVVLDTAGWKAHYASGGSNKEGQTGKQMSYLMTNLKSFAVAKCRGKYGGTRLFNGAVNLLTFLDDGFTAADISTDNYKATAKAVLDVLVDVQRDCGFVMKLKKSFPSDRFCQFLSREYYMGARIYDPVKSVTKRALRQDELVTSLPEDIREVTAWASGATESGTPKEYVYACYIIDCAKTVTRKTGIELKADHNDVSFLFAPTAAGGCGAMPPHGVLASLVKDMYVEQLEILRHGSYISPSIRAKYVRVINADVSTKSGRGILRAHKTVTLQLNKMSEQRVTRAIENKLLAGGGSAYIADMLSACSGPEIEEFGLTVAASNRQVLAVNLDDLYESSPLSMYDAILAKFKKSATLTAALGNETTRGLISAYKNDAIKCQRVWMSL